MFCSADEHPTSILCENITCRKNLSDLQVAHFVNQVGLTAQSALGTRLERFVNLSECETAFIASIELSSQRYPKGYRLLNIGDRAANVWILKSGWAVLKSHSKRFGNQILRIYLPGEIIGLSEFGTKFASHQVIMQTDGVVAEVPRATFHRELAEYPRLSSLLYSIGSLNLTAFHYQVARLNTLSAEGNLKFFFLQLHSRLHSGQCGAGDRFEVPMSQVEIGQVLGITSIYVNKLLRKFVVEEQLEIERPYFRMKAREAWGQETSFVDAFSGIDTSWFPTEITRPKDQSSRKHRETEPSPQSLHAEFLSAEDPKAILY